MPAVIDSAAATLVANLDPGAADAIVLEGDALVDQTAVEEEAILRWPDHPIEVRAVVDANSANHGCLGARSEVGAEAPAIGVLRAAGLRRAGPVEAEPPDADSVD